MPQIHIALGWISKHSEKIFSITGKIAISLLIVGSLLWVSTATFGLITTIPGFQFDPLLVIVLVAMGVMLNRQMSNVNKQIKEIKQIQQQVMESREIVRVKKESGKK